MITFDQSKRKSNLAKHGIDLAHIPTLDLVDAALGALTGLIALANAHSWVGDADEGALLLPVSALPKLPLGRLIDKPLAERAPTNPSWSMKASERTCACGCGALVAREFRQGHDAKLRSRLLREMVSGDAARA